jgi:hypothetical protein
MRLIYRDHPDRIRRQLTSDEGAAVRRFCGAGQEVRPGDVELVEAVLEEMHDGRHVRNWLECDCLQGTTTQPRLTARVREEGPRHFVRMYAYGEHRCALASFRQNPVPEEQILKRSIRQQHPRARSCSPISRGRPCRSLTGPAAWRLKPTSSSPCSAHQTTRMPVPRARKQHRAGSAD